MRSCETMSDDDQSMRLHVCERRDKNGHGFHERQNVSQAVPVLARDWFQDLSRKTAMEIADFTATYLTPTLVDTELAAAQKSIKRPASNPDEDNLEVCCAATRIEQSFCEASCCHVQFGDAGKRIRLLRGGPCSKGREAVDCHCAMPPLALLVTHSFSASKRGAGRGHGSQSRCYMCR